MFRELLPRVYRENTDARHLYTNCEAGAVSSLAVPDRAWIVPHIREFLWRGTPVEIEIAAIATHQARDPDAVRALVQKGYAGHKEVALMLVALAMIELFSHGRYTTADGTFNDAGYEMFRLWQAFLRQAVSNRARLDRQVFDAWMAMKRIELAGEGERQKAREAMVAAAERAYRVKRRTRGLALMAIPFTIVALVVLCDRLTRRGLLGSALLVLLIFVCLWGATYGALFSFAIAYGISAEMRGWSRYTAVTAVLIFLYTVVEGLRDADYSSWPLVVMLFVIIGIPALAGVYCARRELRRLPGEPSVLHRIDSRLSRVMGMLFFWH